VGNRRSPSGQGTGETPSGYHQFRNRREIALDHLKKSLDRAKQVACAVGVDAVPPAGLGLHLFVGESIPTNARASVEEKTGKLKVVKRIHGGGKRDPAFVSNMLYILLSGRAEG